MKRISKIAATGVAAAMLFTALPAAAAPTAGDGSALSSFIETLRDFYRNVRPF